MGKRVLDWLLAGSAWLRYDVAHPDFQNMLEYVHNKAVDGRYFVEAAEPAYTGFACARLREPSRWLTFLIARVDKRVDNNQKFKN